MTLTALFYLVVFGFGLIKSIAGKPIWGLYIYFFCFYFHAPSQWWGQALPDLRWSLIASAVTLFSLILYPPKLGFRFWKFRENKFLLLFALFVVAQLGFSLNSTAHSEYVELLLKFLFFIFLLQNAVSTKKDIEGIIWANLLGCTFLAYLGLSTHSGGRLEGIGTPGMESANQLGQHFALVILMSAYLLLEKLRWVHVVIAGCLSLMLMALFLTESRGVLLSLIATGGIASFFIPVGTKKKFSTFAILALLASSMLMGPQILARFQGVEDNANGEMSDRSAQSRVEILRAQFEMFKDSPWVGHGHRGTLLLSPFYISEEYLTKSKGLTVRASHNVAAAFFVDHGIIGASLYFMAILSACWRIWSVRGKVVHLNETDKKDFQRHACLLAGCVLALTSFMIGGMGSNNKKLEGDIWLLALIPVIHHRVKRLSRKNEIIKQKYLEKESS